MQLSQVVAKLSGAKRSHAGFIAKCPAHEDEKQSLSVGSSGSKVLLNCFAGCPPEKIVEAMGLEWQDLFEGCAPHDLSSQSFRRDGLAFHSPPKAKVAAVYRYTDESGELLYENVRFEPKGFSQRRYDEKGQITWNLRGVRRVPYHLKELAQVRHGSYVWLCEGEKDADSLRELGFTATSFKNWCREFNKYIEKTHVVICRDHDLPGGVQADEATAVTFYQQGCDGDDMQGCYSLGYNYENGLGVKADRNLAIDLYRDVCASGDQDACADLTRLGVQP